MRPRPVGVRSGAGACVLWAVDGCVSELEGCCPVDCLDHNGHFTPTRAVVSCAWVSSCWVCVVMAGGCCSYPWHHQA